MLALLVVALVLLAPASAAAHGLLRRSTPSDSARLTTVPRELRLTFTERPELAVTVITLLGPRGDTVALAPVAVVPDSNRTIVAAIRGGLTAGPYAVVWQTAGADGHVVRGRFTFVIAEDAVGLAPASDTGPGHGAHQGGEPGATIIAPGSSTPPESHHLAMDAGLDAESPAYVAVRWVLFGTILAVLGALVFALGVVRRATPGLEAVLRTELRNRAASIGAGAGVVLLGAVLARLALQSASMHGVERAWDGTLMRVMLTQTVWGWGWLLQCAAAVLVVAGFAAAASGRRGGWPAAAIGGLALAATPALSGHAAAAVRGAPLAIAADTLHVLGAGGWLGSLLFVVIVGLPLVLRLGGGEGHASLAALVRAFTPVALVCAGLTAATGLLAAWIQLPTVTSLWTTRYGWLLLGKLALLGIVAGVGAYNWRRLTPALGDAAASARLRRSARAELVVGAAVLLVTAILVATPTPFDGTP